MLVIFVMSLYHPYVSLKLFVIPVWRRLAHEAAYLVNLACCFLYLRPLPGAFRDANR